MGSDQDPVFWTNKPPQWDPKQGRYYWEGYKFQPGGTTKIVWKYLKHEDCDQNGNPLKGLQPPRSAGFEQSTPRTIEPVDPSSADQQTGLSGSYPAGQDYGWYHPQDPSRNDPVAALTSGLEQWQAGGGQTSQVESFGATDQSNQPMSPGGYMPIPPTPRVAVHQYPSEDNSGGHRRPSQGYYGEGRDSYTSSQAMPSGTSSSHRREREYHAEGSYSSGRHHKSSDRRTAHVSSSDRFYQPQQGASGHLPVAQPSFQNTGGAFTGLNQFSPVEVGTTQFDNGSSSTHRLHGVKVKQKVIDKAPRISKTNNGKELLDPNFGVFPSADFKPGRIIKVMWSEPKGTTVRGPGGSRLTHYDTLLEDHKKEFWRGFRRFIIIHNNEGHCTCVPIYSYGAQGCKKSGAKPSHHGIIYEDFLGNSPVRLQGEPSLGFKPIRAITTRGDPINEASRVNFAKVVTVEHNVKVMFVGEVVPDDWQIAKAAVRSFFD